jgi:hypothetical protein
MFKSLGRIDIDSVEYGYYLEDMWRSFSIVHSPFSEPFNQLVELIRFEIVQMDEEGYDTSSARDALEKLLGGGVDVEVLTRFYNSLKDHPKRSGFPYIEAY